jgi:hypothetical protein
MIIGAFNKRDSGLLLLLAVYAAYSALIYNHGLNLFDEGSVLSAAQRVVRGDILYRDITVAYAPGEYILLAGLFKVFGYNVIVERLMWITAKLIGVVFLFLMSRKLMPAVYAFMVGLLYIFTSGPLHKVFYVAPSIPTMFLFFIYIEKGRRKWLFLAGLAAGVTLVFRQDSGVFMMAIGVIAVLVRKVHDANFSLRTLALDVLSFMTPALLLIFIVAGYFYANDALGDLYYWCFKWIITTEVQYGKVFPGLFPDFSGQTISWGILHYYLANNLFYYSSLFVEIVSIIFIIKRAVKRQWGIAESCLVIVLAWAVLLTNKTILVPVYRHFLQAAVPVYVLGSYILSVVDERGSGFISSSHFFCKRAYCAAMKVLLLSLPLLYVSHHLAFLSSQDYVFFSRTHRQLNVSNAPLNIETEEAKQLEGVVDFINANTAPDTPIYSTTMPGFYFLTGRPNPANYEFLAPLVLKSPDDEKRLVGVLRKKAFFIIHFDFKFNRRRSWEFKEYAPQVDQFIKGECVLVKEFGPYKVYRNPNI